jgi:hypothetical protein
MSDNASFSINAIQVGAASYQYTIDITDTGSGPIGTFWFAWVPGAGYLPDLPQFAAPEGWRGMVTNGAPPADGYSIQWVAESAGDALQPGQSLSGFTFTSAISPSTLFGLSAIHPPAMVDTAVIYSAGPFSDAGMTLTAAATTQQILDSGVLVETDQYHVAVDQPYAVMASDFSSGGSFIGSKFFYTGISAQAYTGEEVDYDGAGQVARALFTGDTADPFSSYEYDYVGGVFAGSKFTYATVPAGATYSSYEVDYNQANELFGDKFFFTNIAGQPYTGEEADFDASGDLTRVVLTGVTDQAYSSLEEDYFAGTYEGYKAFYVVTGQAYTNEEVDVSASNQIEKVVYSGMASTPYSSVEQDYSGGALADTIYEFTNVAGASYYSYQVEDTPGGAGLQETFDLNSGGHALVALTGGQTLTSLGDDKMTGSATGSTTFVLDAVYGADTITNLTGTDIISMPSSEFASFTALSGAASFGTGNAVTTAGDGDTLTLKGVTTLTQLQGLSGYFIFHS